MQEKVYKTSDFGESATLMTLGYSPTKTYKMPDGNFALEFDDSDELQDAIFKFYARKLRLCPRTLFFNQQNIGKMTRKKDDTRPLS